MAKYFISRNRDRSNLSQRWANCEFYCRGNMLCAFDTVETRVLVCVTGKPSWQIGKIKEKVWVAWEWVCWCMTTIRCEGMRQWLTAAVAAAAESFRHVASKTSHVINRVNATTRMGKNTPPFLVQSSTKIQKVSKLRRNEYRAMKS